MIKFAMEMYKKYEDVILYLFFGGLTFLISIGSYYVCAETLGMHYMVANVISWIVAVLFAYITNRIFVFKSSATGFAQILKELWLFIACRLTTGGMEIVIMFIGVTLMSVNDMIVKIISQIVVILSNYVFSKLIIFKKEKIAIDKKV